jgi:hypothetical protein
MSKHLLPDIFKLPSLGIPRPVPPLSLGFQILRVVTTLNHDQRSARAVDPSSTGVGFGATGTKCRAILQCHGTGQEIYNTVKGEESKGLEKVVNGYLNCRIMTIYNKTK